MLKLYNTLTRKIEEFKALEDKKVGLYTCGPTVYNYAHIGNLRTYVFEDILKRVLLYNKYKIKHVMNITDVGHLTDDADFGEDKLEKAARKTNKDAWEIADFYTQAFQNNIEDLNILEPDIWCKATDHIKEQIKLVQALIDKGLTYETSDGIYFDTTKIDDYGKLANLKNQELKAGARVEMGEKKNPHDFALWKWSEQSELHPERSEGSRQQSELHPERSESSAKKPKRQMEWEAPFGKAQGKFGRMGFPGWHIECSAMSIKYLGDQFDIHCGGIDHLPVHHTNEIAQSEAYTGKKPWVKYWLHGEFLLINSGKMAKSEDNFITLDTIKDKGFSPLSYRYFLLQTHYRKQLNFSWEALEAAKNGLDRLYRLVLETKKMETDDSAPETKDKFLELINDDLNIPEALALVWDGLKDRSISYETLLNFDKVLGLGLDNIKEEVEIPSQVQALLDKRAKAREEKDWKKSDEIREEIEKMGYRLEDSDEGQRVVK
ncbi:MAG: class I tRNA ligase family protein [Candidatus Magasanikbacteria bacterium]|nr:class I tRNA ligase family protein [Candidatus Magasanikbacteria bacterium]